MLWEHAAAVRLCHPLIASATNLISYPDSIQAFNLESSPKYFGEIAESDAPNGISAIFKDHAARPFQFIGNLRLTEMQPD